MSEAIEVILGFGIGEDADPDELDTVTTQILQEMKELDFIESVKKAPGVLESGSKGDPITIGAIAVAVLPALLPKLVDFIQEWAKGKQGRTVKFKGSIKGQEVEFEGSAEDLQKLLESMHNRNKDAPRFKTTK